MAVFLERSINGSSFTPPSATGIFDDVLVSYWAVDWIEQLYDDGITTGCSSNPLQYCPDGDVTRATMAIFLLYNFSDGSILSSTILRYAAALLRGLFLMQRKRASRA